MPDTGTQKTPEEILSGSKGFLETLAGLASKTLGVWVISYYTFYVALQDKGATPETASAAIYGTAMVTVAYIVAQKAFDVIKIIMAPKAVEVAMVAQETKETAKTFTEGKPPVK